MTEVLAQADFIDTVLGGGDAVHTEVYDDAGDGLPVGYVSYCAEEAVRAYGEGKAVVVIADDSGNTRRFSVSWEELEV